MKTFIDKNKQGDVFTLSSEDGGEIVVHTVYDKKGNLTGVEIEWISHDVHFEVSS